VHRENARASLAGCNGAALMFPPGVPAAPWGWSRLRCTRSRRGGRYRRA